MEPLLGFVTPIERTPEQHQAHELAMTSVPPAARFALPAPQLAKGDKVRLFDAWSHPKVVADVGFVFTRFHQLTGSCVGAGGGNGIFSTVATQRLLPSSPTKAFLPFWLAPYGMSRHYMGDDGSGEGSLGSTFAKSLTVDGVTDWLNGSDPDNLPDYEQPDGIVVSKSVEMQWSSFRNSALAGIVAKSRQHLFGSAAECRGVEDIRGMILNGYGVTFACNNFVGNGRITGSGSDAYVRGRWDSRGGHQQSVHALWEHPNDGPLYWVQNNWPGSVYPRDPAGGPVCGVWVAEVDVTAALRLDAEVYGLSHLNWFPAQPDVPELLHWMV